MGRFGIAGLVLASLVFGAGGCSQNYSKLRPPAGDEVTRVVSEYRRNASEVVDEPDLNFRGTSFYGVFYYLEGRENPSVVELFQNNLIKLYPDALLFDFDADGEFDLTYRNVSRNRNGPFVRLSR